MKFNLNNQDVKKSWLEYTDKIREDNEYINEDQISITIILQTKDPETAIGEIEEWTQDL